MLIRAKGRKTFFNRFWKDFCIFCENALYASVTLLAINSLSYLQIFKVGEVIVCGEYGYMTIVWLSYE